MFLGFISCGKDVAVKDTPIKKIKTYDTIFPLSYFPAYPGSYWKYSDSNNDTFVFSTDPVYKLDSYIIGELGYHSDTFYVPFYSKIPIWGYEEHLNPVSNSGSSPMIRILSDSLPVGSSWVISCYMGEQISRKIIAKDTSIVMSGITYFPTIVMEDYVSYGAPHNVLLSKSYYTKNIGLIKEEEFYSDSLIENTKFLINYYIKH